MSVIGSAVKVLGGSGRTTLPIALEPGEQELVRHVAAVRSGTLTGVGGDLVLTDQRLLFTPLNTRDVAVVLGWALGWAGAPDWATGLPQQADKLVQPQAPGGLAGLLGLRAVRAGSAASWTKPPTLAITAADGTETEFGILASRLSPNKAPANVVARDRMVRAIAERLPPGA